MIFIFWGYLKEIEYKRRLHILTQLNERIIEEVNVMCERTEHNFRDLLKQCDVITERQLSDIFVQNLGDYYTLLTDNFKNKTRFCSFHTYYFLIIPENYSSVLAHFETLLNNQIRFVILILALKAEFYFSQKEELRQLKLSLVGHEILFWKTRM